MPRGEAGELAPLPRPTGERPDEADRRSMASAAAGQPPIALSA
jgi:hypothetical protein